MCGIVGYMSRSGFLRHKDYFQQALYADGIRGLDATGMFMVNEHTGAVSVVKRAMAVNDFYDLKVVDEAFKRMTSCGIAVGHNRQSTMGAHINANAHPFTHGDFTLVHNGTLRSTYDLPDHKMFDVDSEMICYSFSKIGVEETIKKLNGGFALVWYDSKRKVLQMIRNNERSLYVATSEDSSEIYFASEGGMIAWLCGRQNPPIKLKSIELLKPGVLHTFSYSESKDDKEIKRHEQELKLWEPYVYTPPANPNVSGHLPAVQGSTPATYKEGERLYIGKELALLGLAFNQKITVVFTDKVLTPGMRTYRYEGYMTEEPWTPVSVYTLNDIFIELEHEYRTKIIGVSKQQGVASLIVDKDHLRRVHSGKIDIPIIQRDKFNLDNKENTITLHVKGPDGKQISRAKFLELTQHGCSNCSRNLTLDEQDSIIWLSGDNPLCPECVEEVGGMLTVYKH